MRDNNVISIIVEHQRYEYVRWATEPDASGQPEANSRASSICGDTSGPLLRCNQPY